MLEIIILLIAGIIMVATSILVPQNNNIDIQVEYNENKLVDNYISYSLDGEKKLLNNKETPISYEFIISDEYSESNTTQHPLRYTNIYRKPRKRII